MAPIPVAVERNAGFEGRGHELFVITLVFTIVAACFVAVRAFVRVSLGALGKDDYTIFASLVSFLFINLEKVRWSHIHQTHCSSL